MDVNLLEPGQILDGRYVIQAKIGEGGMGSVYRAVDSRNINRAVAIKVINTKTQLFNADSAHLRLKREKEAYLRITHPNVVQIFDSGSTSNGDFYIVQEFLVGESLEKFLKKHKQVPFEDICWIVPQIASALEAAHSEGIVHRDLKPSNVMLQNISGGGRQVKVIDFGIAKIEKSTIIQPLTTTGSFIGTAWYSAPEQLDNQPASPSTDLWALAVIVYEMVTGVCPYRENSISKIVLNQMRGPKRPQKLRPDLPDAAQEVILKSLKYRPEDRYPEIHLYCEDLLESLNQRSTTKSTNVREDLEETRIMPVIGGKVIANPYIATQPTSDGTPNDETYLQTLTGNNPQKEHKTNEPQSSIANQPTAVSIVRAQEPLSHTLHTEAHSSKQSVVRKPAILLIAGLGLAGILATGLYFNRETPPSPKPVVSSKPISLSYRLLVDDMRGKPFFASGREVYRGGDRFKLLVTPSDHGYLYIINESPNGDLTLLFPAPHINDGSPVVKKDQEISLPKDWYQFDNEVGAEQLFLVLADEPVSELEALRYNTTEEKLRSKFPAAIKWLNEKRREIKVDEQNLITRVHVSSRPLVSRITLQHR